MPSSANAPNLSFFTLDDVAALAHALGNPPLVRGRVWAGEEKAQGWAVECDSFERFRDAARSMAGRIEFLAYDELFLDTETLEVVEDDLTRYAMDEGLSHELVSKALSALRGHEGEMFSVVAYAFLSSGRVLFARAQNELARFVYRPSRLLSSEGLSSVRKLKTLADN